MSGEHSSGSGGLAGGSHAQEESARARLQRWRSFVAMGLVVAPFLPASNLFFWVRPAWPSAHACAGAPDPCHQHELPYRWLGQHG